MQRNIFQQSFMHLLIKSKKKRKYLEFVNLEK